MHFMKFECDEWINDDAINDCSYEAQGIWVKMMCFMNKSPLRGLLCKTNGEPYNVKTLAKKLGISHLKLKKRLNELELKGVFSRLKDEKYDQFLTKNDQFFKDYPLLNPTSYLGVIYSRRMVRQAEHYRKSVACGRKGGNPKLTEGVNPKEYRNKNLEYKKDILTDIERKSDTSDVSSRDDKSNIKNSETKKSKPKQSSPTKGACRIPEEWQPDDKSRAFGEELGLDVNWVAGEFRDYWRSATKNALKKDWQATFKNRCRAVYEKKLKENVSKPVESSVSRVSRWRKQLREQHEQSGNKNPIFGGGSLFSPKKTINVEGGLNNAILH